MDVAMRGDNAYPSEVLADETLPAETFTEYALPPLPEQEGYRALGYVLLKSGGAAYLEGLSEAGANPAPIGTVALGETLTADDLEIVPKDVEGVYNAEIHVVWLADESPYHLEFYDGDELFGDYYAAFPIESEQLLYLAPFPTPTREGKTFLGWQNVDGFVVDAVTYYDFFEKLWYAKTVSDRDMNRRIPCRLYACWSDGSGGAPDPTPVPVFYKVKAKSPCGFSAGSGGGGTKQVQKGSSITIFAKVTHYDYSLEGCYFTVTDSSGNQKSYSVSEYKSVRHDTDTDDYYVLYYKVTIKVTGNITVSFHYSY